MIIILAITAAAPEMTSGALLAVRYTTAPGKVTATCVHLFCPPPRHWE